MNPYVSLLLPVVVGVAAGAAIRALLGIVPTARSTAPVDAARGARNYFAYFVNRSLRNIELFEWMVRATLFVLDRCGSSSFHFEGKRGDLTRAMLAAN